MTDRKTASTINDAELDQLYNDLDTLRAECRAWAEAESADAAAGSYAGRVEELETELAALRQVARGYCPQCGRGDAAPTVADWEAERDKAGLLEITNRALNTAVLEAAERAEQAEELLAIAHDTSNRAETERARAVERAEKAEQEADATVTAAAHMVNLVRDRAERAEAALAHLQQTSEAAGRLLARTTDERDQLAAALREILAHLYPITRLGDPTPLGYQAVHPIHPRDYQRWTNVLEGREAS